MTDSWFGARRTSIGLLVLALVDAAVDHGGFFRTGFRVVILLVLVAAIVGLAGLPASAKDLDPPIVAITALGSWYIVSGIAAGDVGGALPAVELLAGLAGVVVVVRRASDRDRELLLYGVLLVGLLVASSGWVGFVLRRPPLAIPDTCCGGIWRAASTITYANAAAAFLGACLLLASALPARAGRSRVLLLVSYVLWVGFFATFSRGGWIGLLAGLVALGLIDGRHAFARGWPAFVGAVVATGSLLPSLRLDHHPHVALAVVGLVVGAVITVVPRRGAVAVTIALVVVGVAVGGIRRPVRDGWRSIEQGRFTASSPDRSRAVDAALDLARTRPVAGVGPGQVDLTWASTDPAFPGEFHLRYAHNEYLQVLVETGGVGFAILLVGLAATGLAVWKRRRDRAVIAPAGCLAALLALAVHSATDYLWHIPIIPLTGAVLVAVMLPARSEGDRDVPVNQ